MKDKSNQNAVSPLKKAEEIDMNRVIEAVAHMTGRRISDVRDSWLIAREEACGANKVALINFLAAHYEARA